MRRLGLALLLSLICITARSEEIELPNIEKPVSLYIYCQNLTSVDCVEFRRYYFGRVKNVLVQVDDDSATLRVDVFQRAVTGGTEFYGDWKLDHGNPIPVPNRTASELLDYDGVKSEISAFVTQAVIAAIQIKSNVGLEELVISSLERDQQQKPQNNSPYYVILSLNGSASKNGIGSLNPDGSAGPATSNTYANFSGSLNRTTKKTRYMVAFGDYYSKTSMPGPGGATFSASNASKYLEVMGIYSLDKNSLWNVALVADTSANPGGNLKNSKSTTAAVEYNLVPFRVKQPYEFRVDVGVSFNDDHLVLANARGFTHEQYLGLGAQLYGFWLLGKDQKASINTTLSGKNHPGRKGYYSAAASTTFSYLIRRGISFNSSANYSYVKRNLRFPGAPDFSNPVATNYLSGYAGGGYSFSMGVSFKIDKGKGGSLFGIDRRFPNY